MTTDRFDILHDEWMTDYLDRSTAYLKTACGIDIPPDPEVEAILRAWENGSDEKPWQDAGPGSLPDFMISVYHEVMKRITIDLDERLFERLRKVAFDQHAPMAAIVRNALEQLLPEPSDHEEGAGS